MLKIIYTQDRVKIRYTAHGKVSERWIKPISLFTMKNSSECTEYVEAHCELRKENRIFEIGKIKILDPNNPPNPTPPSQAPQTAPPGRIECSVNYVTLQGDYGDIESVQVTCPRCDHVTESFGTSAASVNRCLVLLREECPNAEINFYFRN